jgi:hypothetical protein
MKRVLGLSTALVLFCLLSTALAQDAPVPQPKAPATYKRDGAFTGGIAGTELLLSSVRFGTIDGATRMVLDFEGVAAEDGKVPAATAHPVYSIEYREFPYRLIMRFEGLSFDPEASVQQKPALPFSVITPPDGAIKEIQVFLPGPCEFKVIEIDDPAKLSIDVREIDTEVPEIYTVQITDPRTAEEAYALIERGQFPEGYRPDALVMGDVVVVEQPFLSAEQAAGMDAKLRSMGYASVINARRGDELPQS